MSVDALDTERDDTLPADAHPDSSPADRQAVTANRRSPDGPSIRSGQRLGRYTVLDKLGSGGMGTVFGAHDEVVDRTVALKLLHSTTREEHALRLRREARAMAKLQHPNIVEVYEVGHADGLWFIAMERVQGKTLARWQHEDHDWRDRVRAYLQAGDGLAAAHAAGLVHRDFKPDNCIIDRQGNVRVLDFGLVRAEDASLDLPSTTSSASNHEQPLSLTRTGALMGTVGYMPVELFNGETANARSDQFSFCVSLYEALYDERPFFGDSIPSLLASQMDGEIRPAPKDTPVPARVRQLLLRGLSRDPAQRWPSMNALLVELRGAVRPRSRGALFFVGLTALAAVAVALAIRPDAEPCSDASTRLEEIWNPAKSDELEAAFLASDLSYAPETWTRVERALDERARAWVDEHTRICRATNVEGRQPPDIMDLRMRCMHRRSLEFQEAIGVLADANDTRIQQAMSMVSSLPPLSRCADVEALQAELPPPEDPELARRVEQLRERLALAESYSVTNELDLALAEGEAALEEARALDYAPLLAEARVQYGTLLTGAGRYPEAEQELEQAYFFAVEHHHDHAATRAALQLVFLLGTRRAEPDRALEWSKTALARHAERSDPTFDSTWHEFVGAALSQQGKRDEAVEHLERALEIQQAAQLPDLAIADTLDQLGSVKVEMGKLDEAAGHYQRGLELIERALGPKHPRAASLLNNLGVVMLQRTQLDEALGYLGSAAERWSDALGPTHPKVGHAWANIGNVLQMQGKLPEALEYFERALPIWESTLGPEHLHVGKLLSNIGNLLGKQGQVERALEHHRRALVIIEAARGPEHADVGHLYYSMGAMQQANDQPDEATVNHRRARAILEPALGPEHMLVLKTRIALGNLARQRQEHALAREHAEFVADVLERDPGAPDLQADTQWLLARVLWSEPNERERARALALEAQRGYREIDEGHSVAKAIEDWLREQGE